MNYREAMTQAMTLLGQHPATLFIGQSVRYKGTAMFGTIKDIPDDKKIELPVAEELQMGQSLGLSLMGYIPVSMFPRMDFLLCAMNQLVNHLDKWELLSEGRSIPKVIIRTSVGGVKQLDPGLQHVGNYIVPLKLMLHTIPVIELASPASIMPAYEMALRSKTPTILVEFGDLYE